MSESDNESSVDIGALELLISESLGPTLTRLRKATALKNRLRKEKKDLLKKNAAMFAEFKRKSDKRIIDKTLAQEHTEVQGIYETICAELVVAVKEKKEALATHLAFCETKADGAEHFLNYCLRIETFAKWYNKLSARNQGFLKKYIQVVMAGSDFVEARSIASISFMKKKFGRLLEETYAEWSSPPGLEPVQIPLPEETYAEWSSPPGLERVQIPLLYPPAVAPTVSHVQTLEEALAAVVEAEAAAQPWLARLGAAKHGLSVALAAYDTTIAEMKARADAVRALLEN
jgi:hypothetical protein